MWRTWRIKKVFIFCSKTGLDYVSCSPYRVPVARLSAAQAELKKIAILLILDLKN